jgi:hypothetical protein
MAGYTRQSVADIIANAVIKAAPVNAEFNALRDAFAANTGHKHDNNTGEGAYIPLIADLDGNNKVVVDTANNRISVFVEVSGAPVEQLRIQDGVIVPVTDNDIDLGTSTLEFKNLFIDGIAKIDTLTVDENATVAGTLGVTGLSTLPTVNVDGGTIDGTVIGAATAQAITGTNITATTGFSGTLTGNVTGNLTGNSAGTHTGPVVGDVTGNVTASSGTSTFTDVTINGTLNMNAGTTGTITGLSAPVNTTDATTKTYVDTADALKLNLSGGTMSGAIAMGTNKITGLGTPTTATDAATKGYVDTSVSALIDSAPGTLDTLNELAAALGDDPNFATTVATSIATKVSKAGDTMTGNLVMGANKVTSTTTPTANDDLTRKGYVDTQDALKLSLTGGTMSGAIAMGTSKITGLGDPTLIQDAATKNYVDTQDALKLSLSGGTMTGGIVMGANKVTSTATPTANDDLTRKGYVDSILGSATSAADSAAAAAVSETNAAISEDNAAISEANAAASFDSFDDRYLGAKSSAPTLDNDGNALLTGALFFNTSLNQMFVWNGSAWQSTEYVSNNVDINGGTIDGTVIGGTTPAAISGTTITGTSFVTTGDMNFGDNDKAIFGAGSDLQIYHDGANSYVRDAGTGLMIIQGSAEVRLGNPSGETMLRAFDNGAVQLNYDNALKLATTATGIDVTGTVTADGLTVDGVEVINTGSTTAYSAGMFTGTSIFTPQSYDGLAIQASTDGFSSLYMESVGLTGYLGERSARITVSPTPAGSYGADIIFNNRRTNAAMSQALKIDGGGDISFYEDTGTTPKFFWDASAESLGINVTDPIYPLEVQGQAGIEIYNGTGGGGVLNFRPSLGDANKFNLSISSFDHSGGGVGPADGLSINGFDGVSFATGSSTVRQERLRITSTGNVGIGTSSPTAPLEVSGSAYIRTANTAVSQVLRFDRDQATTGDIGQIQFYTKDGAANPTEYGRITGAATTINNGIEKGDLYFSTTLNGTLAERMRITSTGNVGIGVTPSAWTNSFGVIQGLGGWSISHNGANSNSVDFLSNAYRSGGANTYLYVGSANATRYQQFAGAHQWFNAPSGTAGNPITFHAGYDARRIG